MKRLLVLIAILLGACNPPENPNLPPLRPAVEAYLAAISARDMEALLLTVTGGDSLLVMDSGGIKSETRQQYIDFQRQWFAINDGASIETEILDLVESPAFGHALVHYRISPQNATGETPPQESWSALTFDLENGNWRLSMRSDTWDNPQKRNMELH